MTKQDVSVQVNFRMPGRLKERLEREARESARSLTAEIVYRLEASLFDTAPGAVNRPKGDDIAALRRDVQELMEKLDSMMVKGQPPLKT